MKRTITAILCVTAMLAMTAVSCNIDGQGIYRTIESATETENPDLYRETASRILGTLNIGGTDHLLAVTDGGVIYGYSDAWKTLEKTELMGGKKGEYTPKQDVVMAGSTLYALGLAEPVVYKAEAADINPNLNKISWSSVALAGIDFSKTTIHSIGVFDGKPYLVYSEFSDDDKKELDKIVFLEDLTTARDLYTAGSKTYRFSSFNVSEDNLYLSVLTSGKDEDKEYISFRFNNVFASTEITNEIKQDSRITGAVTQHGGTDDFITVFDPNNNSSHLYHIDAGNTVDSIVPPAVFNLDRHSTVMAALDNETLVIAGRTGLYTYDIQAESWLPSAEEYLVILNDKKINDFYVPDGASGYQFRLAVKDHWVLKVDGKDNPTSRL